MTITEFVIFQYKSIPWQTSQYDSRHDISSGLIAYLNLFATNINYVNPFLLVKETRQ